MRTRTGTASFICVASAEQYYSAYGYDKDDVAKKIANQEIYIGKPALKTDETLEIVDNGLRYAIISAEVN